MSFPLGGADKHFVRISLYHAATILHSAAEEFSDHITAEQAIALAEIVDAIDDLSESIDLVRLLEKRA